MNEDYKKYINAINKLKVDLSNAKEKNNSLPFEKKDRSNQIIDEIEKKLDLLVNNSIYDDNTYIKDVINKVLKSMNNLINILDIIYLKNVNDNNSLKNLNKTIVSEIETINSFIEYTNNIIDIDFTGVDNNKIIFNYSKYISDSILKTKITIDKILYLNESISDNDSQQINKAIIIIKDLLDDKIDYLENLYDNISYLVFKNNKMEAIYSEYVKYGKKIIKSLKNYHDTNAEKIVNRIKYGVLPNIFNIDKNIDYSVYNIDSNNIAESEKKKDTEKYKKDYSLLNISFWEAREKAFVENIKYPSVMFEKKVKEFQNDYLIENYNRSLDEVENSIEEYKIKYAKEIYMDEIYEEALNQLKEESLLSVEEICDESKELSQLDKRAYIILNERLTDVIKQIAHVKSDENLDDFIDVAEYKKNFKLNELLDKKEMIEYNMYLIIKKRDKIENIV